VKDNLVDVRLSEKRDMEAAKAFFAQVDEMVEQQPDIPEPLPNSWE
jgi:transposase-like protein